MKFILFFTPGLNIGGIEKVFITYANTLVSKGYRVGYVCCHEGGELEDLLSSDIEKYSLRNVRLLFSWIPLIKLLRNVSPDYLITGGDYPNIVSIIVSKFCPNLKCIVSQHNYLNIESKSVFKSCLIPFFYNKAYKIISVSNGISDFLLSMGIKKHKLITIYNPINVDEIIDKGNSDNLGIETKDDYLLYVGRLGIVKNLFLLIDVFKNIYKKNNNLNLLLVGAGPEEFKLKKYVSELGLEQNVLFIGALSNPFSIMKNARLILLTSLSEALPTVILESFVMGKTVVSTPTKGAVDLLDNGQYGYLSPDFSVQSFTIKVLEALKNPLEKDYLLKRANDFAICSQVEKLCLLFE